MVRTARVEVDPRAVPRQRRRSVEHAPRLLVEEDRASGREHLAPLAVDVGPHLDAPARHVGADVLAIRLGEEPRLVRTPLRARRACPRGRDERLVLDRERRTIEATRVVALDDRLDASGVEVPALVELL